VLGMPQPLTLSRKAIATYNRGIRTNLAHLWHRHPRPTVQVARNYDEYRIKARAVAAWNARWLRTSWFDREAMALSQVPGYCFACDLWTTFDVNTAVCSTWEGRPVPWWTNTLTCRGCELDARMRAAFHLFEDRILPAPDDNIYITERVTPLYKKLRLRHPGVVGSEYIVASTPKGETNSAGVRCEDLTDLTYPDAQFDHLICLEVLEHIPDYKAALRQCARVLKPGGRLVCSAPFHGAALNTTRARMAADGTIEHLLPPEWHGNPVDPAGALCYRHFGIELLDDLREAGFSEARVWLYWSAKLALLGEDRVLFVADR
jgi:Methyltransferase domain